MEQLDYNDRDESPRTGAAELELLPTGEPVTVAIDPTPERKLVEPGRARPRVFYRARRWIVEIADELNSYGTKRASDRADRICECTKQTKVPVCKCGAHAPGKLGASRDDQGRNIRCHARSCPRCGPARADELRDRVREWLDGDTAPDTDWYHVVFTTAYDPGLDSALDVGALRARLEAVKRTWRKYWRKNKGQAALVGAELGRWGAVHLHALIATSSRPDPSSCTDALTWVSPDPVADPSRSIGELVKYAAKTPCRDAKWWSSPAVVPNPRLIAAWEMATFGSRLVERYGSARSLPDAKEDDEPELERKCASCGADVSDARAKDYPTRIWVGMAAHWKIQPFYRRE